MPAGRPAGADHPILKPKAVLNREMVEALAADYLYMAAIQFILQVRINGGGGTTRTTVTDSHPCAAGR
jgi:hypothetical protein